MAAFEDRLQALMDEVYTEWQKEENRGKDKWDVLEGFSASHQIAVVFGNFHYQVGNGGIEQWIYNGYFHDDAEKFIEYLEVGAASDARCQVILDKVYALDRCANETGCDRSGYYRDPDAEDGMSFIGDSINCDAFDTWYYAHCGEEDWWKTVCGIIDKAATPEIAAARQSEDKAESVIIPPPLQVYIENANDASIGGFTIPLPTTRGALAPWLAAVGTDAGDPAGIKIVEIRSHITELGRAMRDMDATLDELNYLAAKIDGIGKHDRETFLAALEVERYGGGAAQIINLIENIQHFELQPAFNEEMYGDFLLQDAKDISADAFERLEQSEVLEEKHLAAHILRLESLVDPRAYSRSIVEEENGVFTKHGYLADRGEFKEIYHCPEDIPREHQLFSRETSEIAKDAAQPDKPTEKESVMDKIREAREAAKIAPAPKPQDRGDHKKSYEPEV